ncbi:hypothetical protein TNCT_148881 [Trichonephila clavata]|uniref:Uncharacterized protein n=1 Tax=Trichonephila clavata TaxID=2740835 RepID=A0A8X6H3D0_TRICU|nr:hypothetical protein TNCT_148881 [Trichonephila clavata]
MIEEPLPLSPAELSSGDIVLPDSEGKVPDFRRSTPDPGTIVHRNDGDDDKNWISIFEHFRFGTVEISC